MGIEQLLKKKRGALRCVLATRMSVLPVFNAPAELPIAHAEDPSSYNICSMCCPC